LSAKGVSLRAHFVLVCVSEYGELSQQQVADQIAIDRSDLVKLIDQLEALEQVTAAAPLSIAGATSYSLTPSADAP
jgi:DNA-binding MarR family transcriptional regulator